MTAARINSRRFKYVCLSVISLDLIFSDILTTASLLEASYLSRRSLNTYEAKGIADLEAQIANLGSLGKLKLICDGQFSLSDSKVDLRCPIQFENQHSFLE